jgi:hypothetical protein
MKSKYGDKASGMATRALNFFTEFAIRGQIQGVGLGSIPEEWAQNLGTGFIDAKSKSNKRSRRDYGLVELGFLRVGGFWSCFLISLQVHRLWRYDGNVPKELIGRYGKFPKSVQFQDLHRALRALGYEPLLIADEPDSDITRYRIPRTSMLIGVVAKAEDGSNSMPVGAIWAMHHSENSDVWARPVKG